MPTIKSMKEYTTKIYPKLIYTTKVLKQLLCMLDTTHAKNKEFMFLGTIDHNKETETYTILDLFLVPQTNCSAVYCETDDNAYPEWLNENFSNVEDRKLIRLHGHSHVNMGTTPSGTDDSQIMNLCNNVSNYFIQLIVNHRLENTCNIWDKEKNLIFNNVDQYIIINNEILEFKSKTNLNHICKTIADGTYQLNNNIVQFPNFTQNLITNEKTFIDNNIKITINPTNIELANSKDPLLKEIESQATKLIKSTTNATYQDRHYYYDYDYDDSYGSIFNRNYQSSPLLQDSITVKRVTAKGKAKEKTIPLEQLFRPYGEITIYEIVDKTYQVVKLTFDNKVYNYQDIDDKDPLKDNYEEEYFKIKNKATNEEMVISSDEYYSNFYKNNQFEYIGTWCGLVNQFIKDWDGVLWI